MDTYYVFDHQVKFTEARGTRCAEGSLVALHAQGNAAEHDKEQENFDS